MTDIERARETAEAAREKSWRGQSLLRDLFMGRFRLDILDSVELKEPTRPSFLDFYQRLESFLQDSVDPVAIDRSGEYPAEVIEGLARLGAFGMKIPTEYGGLGLSHREYVRVMALLGSHDANVTALLSAHQAIGVPQPVKLFGTEEQKRRFLPRCARGAISAFALTEPAVGSDPGRLATTVTPTGDGEGFILRGAKLWCTNGTIAELIVVMARDPDGGRISAFVVEMDSPGVVIESRCRFMGLKALANAYLRFDDVFVPRENLIGKPGDGLKIALVTLNTGRLSLPAATAGMAKRCTEIVRKWSNARIQWGQEIGKHEAVAALNADIVSKTYAMESVSHVLGELADRRDTDIRLEAAAAKEWNTVTGWHMVDDTLQVRGGRGYETESSLIGRGEAGIGVERMMRDSRINLVFEGSSEIMHLFMAREAVDRHLQVAGALVDPRATLRQRLRALPAIAGFYARWVPGLWLGFGRWPRYRGRGPLARHFRFVHRMSRRLARSIFRGMVVYRAGLERKQRFLFRAVDVAMELFVIACSSIRAHKLRLDGAVDADAAIELADAVYRNARRRVSQLLRAMWDNDDDATYALGRRLLDGSHRWLESGAMPLPYDAGDLVPAGIDEILARHRGAEAAAGAFDGAVGESPPPSA